MMDYLASTVYRNPVPPSIDRAVAASREGRLVGQKCPQCGSVFTGGRGYCNLDSIELGPETEVDLATTGTVTNYVVVTPVQYPGQTETEPFVRVMVLIDDSHVVLGWQPTIELAPADVRVGLRVSAVWASPGELIDDSGGGRGSLGALVGWIPNGEPDIDDPDLVNRIF